MTVRISESPFTDDDPEQWNPKILGPAWVELQDSDGGRWFTMDAPTARGIRRFVRSALRMAGPEVTYGTVYAARLGGGEVTPGEWHYDLGEYREDGADRYVGTWASDGVKLQNVFGLDGEDREAGFTIQPDNNRVVAFNEGMDFHFRAGLDARPGAWGVFVSLALYRESEPANLECPRLADLRNRGERAIQARDHATVARKVY